MTMKNETHIQNIRRSVKLSVLAVITGLGLFGCQPQSGVAFPDGEAVIHAALPPHAQNIRILGNGWATFELEGRKFMFRRTMWDRSATDCITVLP